MQLRAAKPDEYQGTSPALDFFSGATTITWNFFQIDCFIHRRIAGYPASRAGHSVSDVTTSAAVPSWNLLMISTFHNVFPSQGPILLKKMSTQLFSFVDFFPVTTKKKKKIPDRVFFP
jgi:hypothetical protein